eukprot:TRINITY_DN5660_c0_g1_i2.p1 TRINITY_DN5660_c0_g1~~TRINITY_DN5660_c0_g1_i2.p1  ORF type:complete len:165 (-),score=13.02 TRINITY_DN5660_c0_g1_i2:140-634(-)
MCNYQNSVMWQVINGDISPQDVDYYKVLNISRDIPTRRIKNIYDKELSKWRSWCESCGINNFDKNRGVTMFQEILATLLDSSRRSSYDNSFQGQESWPSFLYRRIWTENKAWETWGGLLFVSILSFVSMRFVRTFRERNKLSKADFIRSRRIHRYDRLAEETKH